MNIRDLPYRIIGLPFFMILGLPFIVAHYAKWCVDFMRFGGKAFEGMGLIEDGNNGSGNVLDGCASYLDDWIIKGDVGVSSKTMWAAIKGCDIGPIYGDIPRDPDDFGRCYEFVKGCGISNDDLKIIYQRLPYWKPYIDNWEELCDMYESIIAEQDTYRKVAYHEMHGYMDILNHKSDIIKYERKQ